MYHIEAQNKAIYNLYIPNRFDKLFQKKVSMNDYIKLEWKNGVHF
jgi:hypothetical protein